MKSRDQSKGVPSTDLLVCFPSRAHHFMPKNICSPSTHHLRRCNTRGIGPAGQASPLVCAKSSKRIEISEPTSPKVTCAGQIKVARHKPKSCKSWQSVMEEIEKLHNNKRHKRKTAVGFFKKDVMQFLTCLRNVKFDFHCFGSIHTPTTDVITSDDDEEFQENDDEVSRTVFSKWFMVLQENQKTEYTKTEETEYSKTEETESADNYAQPPPPPNALLLMRCRSAPAKSWLEEQQEGRNAKSVLMEELESKKKKNQGLVVMRYGSDLLKFSSDMEKETWVVGRIKDALSRSLSSKR